MIFVTAEIGTNWHGDFATLETMLRACKKSEVDAVKFQSLSKELIDRHPELTYYKDASLNDSNYRQISDMCDSYDLEFYTTITEPIEFDFNMERVKIRTVDSNNKELIKFALKNFNEVIISSLKPLTKHNVRIKNLYCIPRYPVEYGEINFQSMLLFDGYSNHCKNPLAILKAIKKHIKYLEFHITADPNSFCIDNSVSFNLTELDELMKWIRKYEY